MKNQAVNKGFTMIELAIVIAVFLFIVGASLGIFLSVLSNQKKVLAEQQYLNQISYVEEYMSKAIRMAEADDKGECLDEKGLIYMLKDRLGVGNNNSIRFINQTSGLCQEFFLDNLTHEDDTTPLVIKESTGDEFDEDKVVPITSSNLQIKDIIFSINGSNYSGGCTLANPCSIGKSSNVQPRITMLLKVVIPGNSPGIDSCTIDANCSGGRVCDTSIGKCVYPRVIQTTISQRNLNIDEGY